METLRFLVKGQMIKKDPGCPFNKMVAGSSNYYIAEFDMDETWNGYSCVVRFNVDGRFTYEPIKSGKATIPEEVLKHKKFAVSVIGKNGATILNTNESKLTQIGGI